MDSRVLRPMMFGFAVVVRMKNCRSSGRRQGSPPARPMTPFRVMAQISAIAGLSGE